MGRNTPSIFILLFASLLIAAGLTSCRDMKETVGNGMHHAQLLTLEETDSFMRADIADPWSGGRTRRTYLLVPKDAPVPANRPEGTVLRTPLSRIVAFSSVHAALLLDLGADEALTAMADTAWVVDARLRQRLREGSVADAGSSVQPNAERLLTLKPDIVMASPIEGESFKTLEAAGINVVEMADYMEATPLGRAEWMRFVGRLVGRGEQADSLFSAIEARYDSLRQAAQQTETRPRLLTDRKQGAAWYVPAGGSYLARLYADAGAEYVFHDEEGSGSLTLSPERVLEEGTTADVWLLKYGEAGDLTYERLAADFAPCSRLQAWREKRAWGCNTLRVPYYEETPFHPDLLLRDIVGIVHPEIVPRHVLRYYKPLQ